ncbi:aldehyde dehydrogenase family protein [Kaistia granuli]|uniref:aldehyde dehydrogenase family protein n=1 Tax=Kaistia granuli TaxID=363259 RepID=UPI000381651F|nr:aldehyde dehydrogenase family protein [Kaistia granuli]
MIELHSFYVDGRWVAPAGRARIDVIDPSTEEPIATLALGDEADTDRAVAAARAAFPAWSAAPLETRLAALERLVAVYERRSDELGRAISLEMGAPIDMAKSAQVGAGISHLRHFIERARRFEFEGWLEPGDTAHRLVRDPIGVCGLITPWNWPMNQILLKVTPALLTGCTVILKPSEISPLSGHIFAEMVHEAEFPAGVFNLLHGDGAGVGSRLAAHPGVDMISFTGSTRAGIAITRNAAATVKRVSLELGGKGANILFADADDAAVERGLGSCFYNSGQGCNAPSRMFVHRDIYDRVVETAARLAGDIAVRPASEPGEHLGPVVSARQFEHIQTMIAAGIAEGARLVAGGLGRPDGLERGYFVRPTVFADATNQMTIAREEIFGPVLVILPFETEDEAIAMANDTVYGLTNYVQTRDMERARRVARAMRSGMVEINGVGRRLSTPFGGFKQSGNGREGGDWGIEEFLEVKAISGWDAAN